MGLKQRAATAGILIPLVGVGVLMLPTQELALLMASFVLVGSWEWSRLANFVKPGARIGYVLVMLMSLWLLWFARPALDNVETLLWMVCAWWCLVVLWIRYPRLGKTDGVGTRLGKGLAGLVTLAPAWFSLIVIHAQIPDGPVLTLAALALVWCADSGAYFAGRRWGRHRLAAAVSPGKTWEGFYGGVAAASLFGLVVAWGLGWRHPELVWFVVLCAITATFSVIGDLLESLLKRQRGVKDSGDILPGHGGVLDRIDSLTAAAPVFLSGLLWLRA